MKIICQILDILMAFGLESHMNRLTALIHIIIAEEKQTKIKTKSVRHLPRLRAQCLTSISSPEAVANPLNASLDSCSGISGRIRTCSSLLTLRWLSVDQVLSQPIGRYVIWHTL